MRRHGPAAAANLRNDAVRARQVATLLDLEERAGSFTEVHRARQIDRGLTAAIARSAGAEVHADRIIRSTLQTHPVEDRGEPGMGFTHKEGDVVTIAAPQLGALVSRVTTSDRAAPWTFGTGALMRNLAARKLI